MTRRDVRKLLYATIAVGLVLIVVFAFVAEGRLLPSVSCGAALGALNLYWLIRLAERLLADTPDVRSLILRFVLKYVVMGGLLFGVFLLLDVDALGFLIGFSDLFGGVLLYGSGLVGGRTQPEE